MSGLSEKVKSSVELIRSMEDIAKNHAYDGEEGYYLAFSGGKDSVVTKALMEMAGVKYDAHYRLTSVDPPELVQFIREQHKDVHIDFPRYKDGGIVTMWNLIPRKLMPPTRLVRYCCEYLKESGGDGRFTVTGVRWAESARRKNSRGAVEIQDGGRAAETVEGYEAKKAASILVNDNAETRDYLDGCVTRHKTCLNPIVDWTDDDVWAFIRSERIPYCGLYDEGWHRLGCIGCPMAGKHGREREFMRWPMYKAQYIRSFEKMLEEREKRGLPISGTLKTSVDVFRWWMEEDTLPGQMEFDDLDYSDLPEIDTLEG